MRVMIYDTEAEAEAALALLAMLAEVEIGPGGDGFPIVDMPGGGRGIAGRDGRGGFDYQHLTSTRWDDPQQAPDGRWWVKSLDHHPRFTGTTWREVYSANGGPAFDEIDFPASWLDAAGNLKPYTGG